MTSAEQTDSPGEPRGRRKRRPVGAVRHRARETALQALFEIDLTAHGPDEVLARIRASLDLDDQVFAYVSELVLGVTAARERFDRLIGDAAPQFPVPQLPVVDRNVLRIASFELIERPDVPPKAAINEAVEIAKRFGGDSSSRFVNGVLGTILATVQREDTTTGN